MINNFTPQTNFNSLFPKSDHCVSHEFNLIANTPVSILNINPDRTYAAFINNSEADITLILGNADKNSLNKGIILKAHGGSFEISVINWYVGKVSAISSKVAKLSVVECS